MCSLENITYFFFKNHIMSGTQKFERKEANNGEIPNNPENENCHYDDDFSFDSTSWLWNGFRPEKIEVINNDILDWRLNFIPAPDLPKKKIIK